MQEWKFPLLFPAPVKKMTAQGLCRTIRRKPNRSIIPIILAVCFRENMKSKNWRYVRIQESDRFINIIHSRMQPWNS